MGGSQREMWFFRLSRLDEPSGKGRLAEKEALVKQVKNKAFHRMEYVSEPEGTGWQ